MLLARTSLDTAAFGVVYERHATSLLGWLESQTRDRQVALELTAETFAVALCHAGRFRDPGDGSARAWLFGIAKNLLRTYLRRARIESRARQRLGMLDQTSFVSDEAQIANRVDAQRRAGELQDALRSLPESQRVAVELRVIGELPYEEIAAATGSTSATARLHVSRGLARLSRLVNGRPSGGST